MGKRIKGRKPEIIGKGELTPAQIAFMVDRYLFDNKFTEARSRFRKECSLISGSPIEYAPNNLLSLEEIMAEYISLKRGRNMLDDEKAFLTNERVRTMNLIQNMQSAINTYNLGVAAPRPQIVHSSVFRPNPMLMASTIGSPADCPVPNTPNTTNPVSMPITSKTPLTSSTPGVTNKRKGSRVTNMPAKKTCGPLSPTDLPNQAIIQANDDTHNKFQDCYIPKTSSPYNCAPKVSSHHGSTVSKTLFTQSPNAPSSSPGTPLTQTLCSEIEGFKTPNSTQNNDPNKVSSSKKITHLQEINASNNNSSHDESDTVRRNVKGRIDFDKCVDAPLALEGPIGGGNSTSESDEFEAFDIDCLNFEAFGADFSLSDLFVEFDNTGIEMGLPQKSVEDTSFTGILSERDMNIEGGLDIMDSRELATKPTWTSSSPGDIQRSPTMDQGNRRMAN